MTRRYGNYLFLCRQRSYCSQLASIPVVGSSGFLSSYRDAYKFILNAPTLVQRGYDQYPEGVFHVAHLLYWQFVVCDHKLIGNSEVASAPEDVLSFHEATRKLGSLYIMAGGSLWADDISSCQTVVTSLSRNLHRCFPDVRDEIVCAFDDVMQLQGSEWKTLTVLPAMMAGVARVSNCLFVGLPLCRNEPYLQNNIDIQFAVDIVRSANRITLFPPFLRPIAAGHKFLGKLVEERLTKEKEFGPDWPGKPNDLISWLLTDAQEGEERTTGLLVKLIMSINMAAIHTSSMTFTHALFDLTAHPEHFLPMREEAEHVVKEEGWTKAALNNMVKIDSFLQESQRLHVISSLLMNRRVVSKNGFTFSDGTHIPYGAYISIAANYENPTVFDGFRFACERAERKVDDFSEGIFKRHMVSTAVDHLSFGTGKHTCPGRFFAATELKAMLAHLVINYDVKAEVEGPGVRPADTSFSARTSPTPPICPDVTGMSDAGSSVIHLRL
ncbi:cytochrome P450 [Mycena maculata]|uniref:Cytochrome P450 n=1 Tax=Mycena maculata TaxID=230809 RepID=A0AAD7K4C3_9AGAR|nr:cytochrome P450 [Mycena maculata]